MTVFLELVAKECHVSTSWVEDVIRAGATRVVKIKVPKRDTSKYRLVSRPSNELEILQRWLLLRFFERLEMHNYAMAFRKGRSIVANAQRHRNGKYFIRIDFADFFPSITFSDFIHALMASPVGKALLDEYPDARRFIERVCFDLNLRLPIGYVTSPIISNFVMGSFDRRLESLVAANAAEIGIGTVTRYADDVVFSTDKPGGCEKFLLLFSTLVATTASPVLKINSKKTNFTSRAAGSAIVTGLRVCADGHITVTRKQKDEARLLLSLYAKGKLKSEDVSSLRGHLAYLCHAAPAFYSKLCLKYVGKVGGLI
jgi:hypothetical protein